MELNIFMRCTERCTIWIAEVFKYFCCMTASAAHKATLAEIFSVLLEEMSFLRYYLFVTMVSCAFGIEVGATVTELYPPENGWFVLDVIYDAARNVLVSPVQAYGAFVLVFPMNTPPPLNYTLIAGNMTAEPGFADASVGIDALFDDPFSIAASYGPVNGTANPLLATTNVTPYGYYIADRNNNVIRQVDAASPYTTSTILGNQNAGCSYVNDAGTAAGFCGPSSIRVDNLNGWGVIVDSSNYCVRGMYWINAALNSSTISGICGSFLSDVPPNNTVSMPYLNSVLSVMTAPNAWGRAVVFFTIILNSGVSYLLRMSVTTNLIQGNQTTVPITVVFDTSASLYQMFWAAQPLGVEWNGMLVVTIVDYVTLNATIARHVTDPASDSIGSMLSNSCGVLSINSAYSVGTTIMPGGMVIVTGGSGGGLYRFDCLTATPSWSPSISPDAAEVAVVPVTATLRAIATASNIALGASVAAVIVGGTAAMWVQGAVAAGTVTCVPNDASATGKAQQQQQSATTSAFLPYGIGPKPIGSWLFLVVAVGVVFLVQALTFLIVSMWLTRKLHRLVQSHGDEATVATHNGGGTVPSVPSVRNVTHTTSALCAVLGGQDVGATVATVLSCVQPASAAAHVPAVAAANPANACAKQQNATFSSIAPASPGVQLPDPSPCGSALPDVTLALEKAALPNSAQQRKKDELDGVGGSHGTLEVNDRASTKENARRELGVVAWRMAQAITRFPSLTGIALNVSLQGLVYESVHMLMSQNGPLGSVVGAVTIAFALMYTWAVHRFSVAATVRPERGGAVQWMPLEALDFFGKGEPSSLLNRLGRVFFFPRGVWVAPDVVARQWHTERGEDVIETSLPYAAAAAVHPKRGAACTIINALVTRVDLFNAVSPISFLNAFGVTFTLLRREHAWWAAPLPLLRVFVISVLTVPNMSERFGYDVCRMSVILLAVVVFLVALPIFVFCPYRRGIDNLTAALTSVLTSAVAFISLSPTATLGTPILLDTCIALSILNTLSGVVFMWLETRWSQEVISLLLRSGGKCHSERSGGRHASGHRSGDGEVSEGPQTPTNVKPDGVASRSAGADLLSMQRSTGDAKGNAEHDAAQAADGPHAVQGVEPDGFQVSHSGAGAVEHLLVKVSTEGNGSEAEHGSQHLLPRSVSGVLELVDEYNAVEYAHSDDWAVLFMMTDSSPDNLHRRQRQVVREAVGHDVATHNAAGAKLANIGLNVEDALTPFNGGATVHAVNPLVRLPIATTSITRSRRVSGSGSLLNISSGHDDDEDQPARSNARDVPCVMPDATAEILVPLRRVLSVGNARIATLVQKEPVFEEVAGRGISTTMFIGCASSAVGAQPDGSQLTQLGASEGAAVVRGVASGTVEANAV